MTITAKVRYNDGDSNNVKKISTVPKRIGNIIPDPYRIALAVSHSKISLVSRYPHTPLTLKHPLSDPVWRVSWPLHTYPRLSLTWLHTYMIRVSLVVRRLVPGLRCCCLKVRISSI